MQADLPKTLILSDEGPQLSSAGGILLYRLFHDYPPDKLRILSRTVPAESAALPGVAYRELPIPWHRFERSRFHKLKRSLTACGIGPVASASAMQRLLGDFQPDVLVTVMQHASYFETARSLSVRWAIPLILIVHDNNEAFEPVYSWAFRAARRRDARCYGHASRRFCVSPEMEGECADKFGGVRGEVLYPNRDETLQPREETLNRTLRRPSGLTLGFAGNLGYGYGQAILQALPALRATGTKVIIFSRPPGPAEAELLQAGDCCEFRPFASPEILWNRIKQECDATWLPYPDPAGKMEQLYRTHFPSKLPEYLALGMPVLISGPPYSTGVKWARRNGEAVAVASPPTEQILAGAFVRLRDDASSRAKLAHSGTAAGNREFDPQEIRRRFLVALAAA